MGTRNGPQIIGCILVFLICIYYILYGMNGSQSLLSEGGMSRAKPFYLYRSSSAGTIKGDELEAVIMFHALPKCGSRTLLTLSKMGDEYRNGLLTVDANITLLPKNMIYDEDFASDYLLRHVNHLPKPLFVYTHARFVELHSSGGKPRYVSVIRDPLSRLVSSYYYKRNRDGTELTEKENKWRSTLKNLSNETFDECVGHNGTDCTGRFKLISTISHFCGPDKRCNTDVEWALARAKSNVVHNFDVIGIMEDYTSFVQVVEAMFTQTFNGITENYSRMQNEPSGVSSMKTQKKIPPSEKTKRIMTERLEYDYQFYNFVKDRFYKQKKELGL